MSKNSPAIALQFDEQGLLPCIVQDWVDGTVLMVGFMNREAWEITCQSQRIHFWSRSRKRLWKKGETSGHELILKEMFVDCDRDTILVKVQPIGPTCHTGNRSCFFSPVPSPASEKEEALVSGAAWGGITRRLYEMAGDRKVHPNPESYVSKLMEGGVDRILKKVVEEAGEVLLAGKNGNREEIIYELADLWFHSLIMLGHFSIPPEDIYQELGRRFGKSGIRQTEGDTAHG
jgi:phosphoribosyl-AMP cyclohydrolase / phosphoribosyl-ATP pyrophosphohydrolase